MTLSPAGPLEIVTANQQVIVNCTLPGESVYKNLVWVRRSVSGLDIGMREINATGIVQRLNDVYTRWLGYNTLQLVIPAFHGIHSGYYVCHSVRDSHSKYIQLKLVTQSKY
jgi:hypothetical protein